MSRKTKRNRNLVAAIVLVAGATQAFAACAGPWEVGGLGVDRRGKLKIEATLNDSGGNRTWARPVLGWALPWNERMSFEFATGYGVVERADGSRSGGGRDIDAKLKYQLVAPVDGGNAWLFEPKLTIPTGDAAAGIGKGKYAVELPLRVGRAVGATTFTAELRYSQVLGGDDSQKLVGLGGLVEYAPTKRWVAGIDLITDAPVDDPGRQHLRSNIAGKWRPAPDWELQALAGRSLDNRRGAERTSYKLVLEYKY